MSKSGFTSIIPSLSQQLQAYFSSPPLLVAGISGGPDSMALLYALHKLQVNTFVVHINYGLRGAESDKDQELVEGMASVWGFECCSVRLDANPVTGNFQNWAREQRYRIFDDFVKELNAQAIAVAHHQDDQLETILQKLLRGSGIESWQGLKPWNGKIFRPLLPFTKNEILNFCEAEAIPFRHDQSNFEMKYARNVLRSTVREQFDRFFPGWQKNLLALPEMGRLASTAIEYILGTLKTEMGLEWHGFSRLDDPLKRAILKKWVEAEIGHPLTQGQLTELAGVVNLQVGKSVTVDSHYTLVRNREFITLKKTSEFNVLTFTPEQLIQGVYVNHLYFEKTASDTQGLRLDWDKLAWPLTMRRWKNGDRFQPLGMQGTQKISDHLTNRKIFASHKKESLILTGADGTIYALFFPEQETLKEPGTISELVKVTESTQNILTITRTK